MTRIAVAAAAFCMMAVLTGTRGLSVEAQPVASIALPAPGGTEQLYAGCNLIAVTFPDGTTSQTVIQAVTPSGVVEALWRYNAGQNRFEAFSPSHPQASDLLTVDFLGAVWLCMSGGAPAGPSPSPTTPALAPTGVILQEGNNLPQTPFLPKRSNELADNHIGGGVDGLAPPPGHPSFGYAQIINDITTIGFKRYRLTVEGPFYVASEFSIDPVYDDVISALAENGVTLTYFLAFSDTDYRARGGEVDTPRFQTEDQIQRYLDFVRFIVHHFKDRIQYYAMWIEPSVEIGLGYIEVEDYINLVRRTLPVIREEYPQAKIIVGDTAYLRTASQRDYLFTILQSDIMPLVDVVSWHPMYGTSPEFDSEYYYQYPAIVEEIKAVASAHGFRGEYEASEVGWWSRDLALDPPMDPPYYSNTVVAKYFARGVVIHRGLDVGVNLQAPGPIIEYFIPGVQSLCTIMAGAEPITMPVQISSGATNIRTYSFSLPNGDRLIAVWTDGVAVDDDPGIKATLTLKGLSAQGVVGIDILNSLEQPLTTSMEGGTFVIRNLLVRDYPLILRLTGIGSP